MRGARKGPQGRCPDRLLHRAAGAGGKAATPTIANPSLVLDAAALEITDDGAVLASLAPGPVVNADRAQGFARAARAPANRSKQRIFTDRDCQAACQVMSGTPAQCEPETMHDAIHPHCSAG
jgi:hypothetical protein